MRFCKQRDGYSCGAVVLLNADKFFGKPVTYRDLPHYQRLVDCRPVAGTQATSITRILGNSQRKSWCGSKRFLQDGNCIIVLKRKGGWGHFYLMATNEYGCVIIVNRYCGVGCPSAEQVLPQTAARMLKTSRQTWYLKKGIRDG